MSVPDRPKLYHITHVDNLPQIIAAQGLWSDSERLALGMDVTLVGMSDIKRRRLEQCAVRCHRGTTVGEYVPFNFCFRSVMLYILHRGNLPDLAYKGGQQPLIHLQADLHQTVEWAHARRIRWAYSDRNASSAYAAFFDSLSGLDRVNWQAVYTTDFRDSRVKEEKQAEFLLHSFFPWHLIERIGVRDSAYERQASDYLSESSHKPIVSVERTWYY